MTQHTQQRNITNHILFGVSGLILLFSMGCKKNTETTSEALVSVQAEHPEFADIAEHVVADATLAPLSQAAISPKITAPVHEFYVQRGSKVKAGQLLVILENRDLAAQALDNKGQLNAAEASFEIETKAQVPEEYAKAELDVAQTKAQLHLQGEVAASRQRLFQQGAIAGRDYDSAVAALAQAQAAYDAARNHLHALSSVSNDASKRVAQGQLSSAKGKFAAAEAQVSYSRIVSPISGVVTDRPLFPGETAAAGSPIITVMDTSSLIAKVHLSQSVAQRLTIGATANLKIPGVDEAVPGTVSLISPALDPGSTTVEVWVKVENTHGTLKAGSPVQVTVTGRSVMHALKIPLAAVLTSEDGSKSVMVISADGSAHKVIVHLGITDGEDVQVIQGVSASQSVITQGAYGLSDGTKVKVGKASEEGDEK